MTPNAPVSRALIPSKRPNITGLRFGFVRLKQKASRTLIARSRIGSMCSSCAMIRPKAANSVHQHETGTAAGCEHAELPGLVSFSVPTDSCSSLR